MDQYVKISEVGDVVKDAMMTIYDKLKKSDDIARDNRTKINNLGTRIEACIRSMKQIGQL